MTRRTPVFGVVALVGPPLSSRIDPVGWDPPDSPSMTGPLAENRELADCERAAALDGPEDVAFDNEGRMYAGAEDDTVYRTVEPIEGDEVDAQVEAFAQMDGRPLGMEFAGEDLLVAASAAGLQSVAPDGSVTTLTTSAEGRSIAFADDLHVAEDGTVYLTDASVHEVAIDEMFELRDTGRLLAYDREAGETTEVTGDLGFANGVEPHPAGDSLLVTESSRLRMSRCWTDGPQAGESEIVADNLPGIPDNVDRDEDGNYWVAIPALRTGLIERIQRHPRLARQMGRIPEWLLESSLVNSIDPYGLVLQMDADGEIHHSLHDPDGGTAGITSATPHQRALYLGRVYGDGVYRYDREAE